MGERAQTLLSVFEFTFIFVKEFFLLFSIMVVKEVTPGLVMECCLPERVRLSDDPDEAYVAFDPFFYGVFLC
jgi:hypothetical protein